MKMRGFSCVFVLVVLCVPYSNSFSENGLLESQSVFYGLALTASRREGRDTQCKLQLSDVAEGVVNNTRWAVKLLDASGVPQSGLYWGGTYWLGSQSQCKVYASTKRLGILPSRVLEIPNSLPPFPTAYYAAYFRHDSNMQRLVYMGGEDLVTLGLCLPSSCAEEEISELMQDYFDSGVLHHQRVYNMSLKMEGVKKTDDDMSWIWSPRHKLFILVMALIFTFNLAGTFYSANIHEESNHSNEICKKHGTDTDEKANDNNGIANGTMGIANGRNGFTKGPDGVANGPNGIANGCNGITNAPNGIANGPNGIANGCNGIANAPNGIANGSNGIANGPNGIANGCNGIANGSNGMANGCNGITNGPNGIANGCNVLANELNGRSNGSKGIANGLNGITKVTDIIGNGYNGISNGTDGLANGTVEMVNGTTGIINKVNETTSYPNEYTKSRIFQRILLGFNIEHNIRKVFDQEHEKDVLLPLNGIRTMLMMMMVFGHITIYAMDKYEGIHKIHYSDDDFASQVFQNAPFIVDTFYCMSGFLLGYTFFKNPKNQVSSSIFSETRKDFLSAIFKRFKRLTPLYAFCILSAPTISEWLYRSSALWSHERPDLTCPQYWWANLLYISNVFPRAAEVCMTWGYYLSNDMQFYIAGSLVLYMSKDYFKMAASIGVGVCMASGLYTAYLVKVMNFKPYYHLIFETVDIFYSPPWMRISPYIIGVFSAYFYYHHRDKIPTGKYSMWFLWALCAACFGFPLFGLVSRDISTSFSMLYLSTTRVLWSLGSVWMMVACLTNNAGKFGRIMSKDLWIPLARLTYCVYLINPTLVMIFTTKRDKNLYYGEVETLLDGLGIVVVSFIAALVLVVLVDNPINNLIDVISNHKANIEIEPKPLVKSCIISDPKTENRTVPNGRLCFKSDLKIEAKITPNGKMHSKFD